MSNSRSVLARAAWTRGALAAALCLVASCLPALAQDTRAQREARERALLQAALFSPTMMAVLELGFFSADRDLNLSGSSFTPALSEGVSATAGFVGLDFRVGPPSLQRILQQRVLETYSASRSDRFLAVGPFFGVRVRQYFDRSGEQIGVSVHPGPAIDTTLAYAAQTAWKFYAGYMFLFDDPFAGTAIGEFLAAMMVSPYAGVAFERGELSLVTDENGPVSVFNRSHTRGGPAVGVDVDFIFRNLPYFIGLGLQLDFLPAFNAQGFSVPNNFHYRFGTREDVAVTIALRLGLLFNPEGTVRAISRVRGGRES